MSNYTDECIKNYNCPDCNEAKLQSDKNARKINEVIDQVNALIQVNNETVNFIKEKSVEISEEVAKIKATEVANKVAETKVNELLDELITEIDNSKVGFDGKIHGTLKDRLDNDFNDIHQKVNDSSYLEYEGCFINAYNTCYGLQKDTVIKGRTLQNLVGNFLKTDNNASYENGVGILPNPNCNVYFNNDLLKSNTVYTCFINVVQYDCSERIKIALISNDGSGLGFCELTPNNVGLVRIKISGMEKDNNRIAIWRRTGDSEGIFKFKDFMILEGDHTQTPLEELPYIDGIESVGESELTDDGYKISVKSIGKNLFDGQIESGSINTDTGLNAVYESNLRTTGYIKVKSNTSYIASFNIDYVKQRTTSGNTYARIYFYDYNKNFISFEYAAKSFVTPLNCSYVRWLMYSQVQKNEIENVKQNLNLKIEEGETATPYEPYKESTYSYILNEPLRSLPNRVYDTIDLETGVLTRRVGKVVLDNSGAVTYYELAEPTTEQLTPQQLKSFDTTTHIISDNKLMPVVSSKIPSNVQAVVTNLINENIMLTNEIETISLEIEENNLNNIETNLNQEERLTLIEMGVL